MLLLKAIGQKIRKNIFFLSLLVLGSLTWIVTMFKSGWMYSYGLGFWGPNGHDGLWHIALANSLKQGSVANPVFAGFNLQNYHIGFDLLLSLFSKITNIDVKILYFQLLPIVFSIVIGVLVYIFVKKHTDKDKSALWSLFFVFFGGSFAWVVGKGESAFWAQQSISTLINPPFALSLIFFLLGLLSLKNFLERNSKRDFVLSILFFSLLVQIKVYAALLVIASLGLISLIDLIFNKSFKLVLLTIFVVILSIIMFVPLNKFSYSMITWRPFWFLETMMSYSDRLGWQRFYSAMTTYKFGNLWIKLVLSYSVAFVVFFIGNLGTRVISFLWILKYKQFSYKDKLVNIFLFTTFVFGLLIPMFFVQQGTSWNTIQFFYYSLFVASIFSGMFVGEVVRKNILFVLIILFTVPTTIITLKDVYIPSRPPAMVSDDELKALEFLKKQPEGVVLTYPFDKDKAKEAENNPPRPLYLYESTAYVSAFSNKTVFLEDEVNLNITGYDWPKRKEEILLWLREPNQTKAIDFLEKNNIKYVYWIKPQRALLGESQLGLSKIFENKEVIIYEYGQDFRNN